MSHMVNGNVHRTLRERLSALTLAAGLSMVGYAAAAQAPKAPEGTASPKAAEGTASPKAPAGAPSPKAQEGAQAPTPASAAAAPAQAPAEAPAADDPQGGDAMLTSTPGSKALGISILGNQEAPTSLVIVPWKSSELGNSLGISPLLDDSRQPVDKDVFMRSLRYYEIRSEPAGHGGMTTGGRDNAAAESGAVQPSAARRR